MASWAGVVLAHAGPGVDRMHSRLATSLHPVAGRPLVWHTAAALAAADPAPSRLLIATDVELAAELFDDVGVPVEVLAVDNDGLAGVGRNVAGGSDGRVVVADAGAALLGPGLQRLLGAPAGTWLGAPASRDSRAAAAMLESARAPELFRLPDPLAAPNGALSAEHRVDGAPDAVVVRDRAALAAVQRGIRDRLVAAHLAAGVTFLLPETVLVDVDVRIGSDTVIYPHAVLEGRTHVGEETVIGPGCRIMDSRIGSGVELKGWNFIANTSVRNRAILEPYVRRGYD